MIRPVGEKEKRKGLRGAHIEERYSPVMGYASSCTVFTEVNRSLVRSPKTSTTVPSSVPTAIFPSVSNTHTVVTDAFFRRPVILTVRTHLVS